MVEVVDGVDGVAVVEEIIAGVVDGADDDEAPPAVWEGF